MVVRVSRRLNEDEEALTRLFSYSFKIFLMGSISQFLCCHSEVRGLPSEWPNKKSCESIPTAYGRTCRDLFPISADPENLLTKY